MKRLIYFLLCFSLVFSLCACKESAPTFIEPVKFYYCHADIGYNSEEGIIDSEVREGTDFQGDILALLQEYIKGPMSETLISPLPYGTTLVSCEKSGNIAYLTFNKAFSSLSGINLTTACSCIIMTLNEYAGITHVQFRAESGQLDNKDIFTMAISDIILIDEIS